MGSGGPRSGHGGDDAAGAGRSRCRLTDACGCRGWNGGWTGSCRGFGAGCGRRLDWDSFSCQPRSYDPPSISGTPSAGERGRHGLPGESVRHSLAECTPSHLKNQTIEAWETAGRPPAPKRPREGEVIGTSRSSGPIVRYQSHTPGTDTDGDIDAMSLWAGQSAGLVSKLQPAGDIVREIAEEARLIFHRLSK